MIPFRVTLQPGASIFDQVVYAATRAMISGGLRAGEPFPSVRALSRELKINPNTAHKVVAHLVAEGLLETRPGIGTVVATMPDATRQEQAAVLGAPVEELVVEARRAGVSLGALQDAVQRHWRELTGNEARTSDRKGRR